MNAVILTNTVSTAAAGTTAYSVGAFIALILLAYLLYALIKPEKF
jgi:K+-transporting ATPase KdpF subunit